ncbi:MAG: class F sortase [Bacillota bacterium]
MKRISVLIITLFAVGVFGYTLIHALYLSPQGEQYAPAHAVSIGPVEEPDRLIIPSLSIDANVQQVGLTKAGNMGIPSNFKDVAWYKYGTAPGQKGSAVIDGHVDNGLALPGVFKHLGDIAVGDTVQVHTKQGSTLTFAVDEIERYPKDAVPLDKVFSRADTARLTLITCTGDWVQAQRTYDTRLIVYTHLVNRVEP